MAINPGIALGVESAKPIDMLGAYGKAMSIKELVDNAKLRGLQEQQIGQKMQFDAQDNLLGLAQKRIKLSQGVTSGLLSVPAERRAQTWPTVRQTLLQGGYSPNEIPEQYPGDDYVVSVATMLQDPDKVREVERQAVERLAYMEAQRNVQQPRGMSSAAPGTTGSAGVEMNEDGTANLTAPQVTVRDDVSRMPNPNQMFALYDLIQQDPRIAGTPLAQQVLENALKLKQEQEQSPSRGMQYIKGEDGQTYVVKNGVREDAIPTGNDPNAQFWRGPDGQPIPNQARIDAELAQRRAGATRVDVNAYPPNALEPGKATRAKIEEETMAASASIQRFDQIQRGFRNEYLQFAPRVSAGWAALKEKGGATLAPGDRRFLQEFSAWSRGAIEEVNTYIQQKTGAAMGVQEAQRLRKGVPDPGQGLFDGDSPTQFKAKLDDTIRQLKLVEARSLYALNNGLSLMGTNGEPVVPLSAMPKIMNERGLQIEQQVRKQFPNLNAKELEEMVVKRLGVEFGIGAD
jgi:hypothetical protein